MPVRPGFRGEKAKFAARCGWRDLRVVKDRPQRIGPFRKRTEKRYVVFAAQKNDRLFGAFRKQRQVFVTVAEISALADVVSFCGSGKRDVVVGRKENGGYKTPASRQDKDIFNSES